MKSSSFPTRRPSCWIPSCSRTTCSGSSSCWTGRNGIKHACLRTMSRESHTVMHSRPANPSASLGVLPGAIPTYLDDTDEVVDEPLDTFPRSPNAVHQPRRVTSSTVTPTATTRTMDATGRSAPQTPAAAVIPPPRQPTPQLVPDVLWTPEDEERLRVLEESVLDDDALEAELQELVKRAESPVTCAASPESPDKATADGTDADAERERKRAERNEGRKRMADLLSASVNRGASRMRRPRWRLELEAADGLMSREDIAASAMSPLQIFRSAVFAVMALQQIEALFLDRRAKIKTKAMQDFEAMLNEYFDVTRGWLARVVKAPLLSVLQDQALDINVGGESSFDEQTGALRLARRITSMMSRKPSPSDSAAVAAAKEERLLKLKVRVKAVIDTIVRSVDKGEVPVGILEFWRRMTSDGVYFPPSYQLFTLERQVLAFDALGATRWMTQDGSCLVIPPPSRQALQPDLVRTNIGQAGAGATAETRSPQAFPRFHVVLVNFVLVRILIPHIVARPWLAGIGHASQTKRVKANLRSMATLLYLIFARLSPLPGLMDLRRPVRGAAAPRRASLASKASHEQPSAPVPASGDVAAVTEPSEPRFLTMDELGKELALGFPSDGLQVAAFITSQQEKLAQALRQLQSQLAASE